MHLKISVNYNLFSSTILGHRMTTGSNYNYDNVRGEMRGPFVRYNPEGGLATLSGIPRLQDQQQQQGDFAGTKLARIFNDERSSEIFLHDIQFVWNF